MPVATLTTTWLAATASDTVIVWVRSSRATVSPKSERQILVVGALGLPGGVIGGSPTPQ